MYKRSSFSHKHKAIPCKVNEIRFPSKLEGRCYALLESYRKSEKILFVIRQAGFDLPGGKRHFVDFAIFGNDNMIFAEAKGRDLAMCKMKREMVEELYGVKIHVVKTTQDLASLCTKHILST